MLEAIKAAREIGETGTATRTSRANGIVKGGPREEAKEELLREVLRFVGSTYKANGVEVAIKRLSTGKRFCS